MCIPGRIGLQAYAGSLTSNITPSPERFVFSQDIGIHDLSRQQVRPRPASAHHTSGSPVPAPVPRQHRREQPLPLDNSVPPCQPGDPVGEEPDTIIADERPNHVGQTTATTVVPVPRDTIRDPRRRQKQRRDGFHREKQTMAGVGDREAPGLSATEGEKESSWIARIGAGSIGRPYMSRAERAVEVSKEVTRLR